MATVGMLKQYNVGNNTLYTAMQSRLANRSVDALAEEERQDKSNGLTNIAALMRANNVRVSDRTDNIEDSVAVMFNDPKTNERITLNLSKDNLTKLKGQFGADDFYTRKDGVIRLNNKAEAFVSGWFGDIAYQQNYAEADLDRSGRITGTEALDLNAPIVFFTYDNTTATDVGVARYVKGVAVDDTIGKTETIEDMLNAFITMDKNFDGNIEELSELYNGDKQKLINEIDQAIIWAERNAFNNIGQNNSNDSNDSDLSNLSKTSGGVDWKKKFEELKKLREELDEQFAEQAEKAKEQLEQISQKEIKDIDSSLKQSAIDSDLESKETHQIQTEKSLDFDNPELSPVVDEIRSKVANNDVQLFEVRA